MKLHPLSIPYRTLAGTLNLGTLVLLVTLVGSGTDPRSVGFLGMLAGYVLLMVGYQVAYVRRFEYRLSSRTLDIESGVVSRRQREIPFGRIQNVDVSQNPVQRALGIAALRVETAGGGDTEALLQYVGEAEADSLRAELRRAARVADDRDDAETAGAEAPEVGPHAPVATGGDARGSRRERVDAESGDPGYDLDEEREEVFELSIRNLAILSLFSIDTGAGAISSLFGALASGGDPENLAGVGRVLEDLPVGRLEAFVTGLVVVALVAWLLSVGVNFARYYGFRLYRVGDEYEYERGLLQRYSGTIPADKIQTLSLHENPVHRRLGYASLEVETAGYGQGRSGGESQAAVPMARRSHAVAVARDVAPFAADELTAERPPKRSRERYVVRYAMVTFLAVVGIYAAVTFWFDADFGPYRLVALVPFVVAPVAAHLHWRNLGYRADEEHFLARAGFWHRTTRLVPYYRIQTIEDSRTAFQRRRHLASVAADTASSATLVGGGAVAVDIDGDDATDLVATLHERFRKSLRERRARRERRRDPSTGSELPEGGSRDGRQSSPRDPGVDGPHGGDPGAESPDDTEGELPGDTEVESPNDPGGESQEDGDSTDGY